MHPTIIEMRNVIGDYIEISSCRLKNYEVEFLYQFISQYDRFRQLLIKKNETSNSWSSDGKFTRWTETKYYFDDSRIQIIGDWSSRDDDGDSDGGSIIVEMQGRNVIEWFIENHELEGLFPVRDIMAIIMIPFYEKQFQKPEIWKQKNAARKIESYLK